MKQENNYLDENFKEFIRNNLLNSYSKYLNNETINILDLLFS